MSPVEKLKAINNSPTKAIICKKTGHIGYVANSTVTNTQIPVQTPRGSTLLVQGRPKIELEVFWAVSTSSGVHTVDIADVRLPYTGVINTAELKKPFMLDNTSNDSWI